VTRNANLIQRVLGRTPHVDESDKGLDRWFCFEYMGASEFEWGALPEAAKLMRSASILAEPLRFRELGDVKFFYVGRDEDVLAAERLIVNECLLANGDAEHFRTKEQTGLRERFGPVTDRGNFYDRVVAWWCIDRTPPAVPWVIFTDEGKAKLWIRCLRGLEND